MISQKCPKCLSDRVRRGYRPTPLWSKILFRYNLLCDNCNWEFVGFAVPGTVSAKPTKNPKKKQIVKSNDILDEPSSKNSINSLEIEPPENLVGADNLPDKSVEPEQKVKRKSGV
jgi:hypothetical protein